MVAYGFLLVHIYCVFFTAVLTEEQKQNVEMFVDPVNKFFQVWCVCGWMLLWVCGVGVGGCGGVGVSVGVDGCMCASFHLSM